MRPRLALALATLVVGLAIGCAPSLAVPPRLVASWPAAGASLPIAPHTIELTFNRALRVDGTWAVAWLDEDGTPIDTQTEIDPNSARRLMVQLRSPMAGAYRLHWHVAAARSGAADDGELEFKLAENAPAVPRLGVSTARADNGDKIEITGQRFRQKSEVRLTIGDEDQTLGTVSTDGRGAFDTEVRVPVGLAFGEQRISAVDSSGSTAATAVQVRWGGWPPLVAYTVAQPGPTAGEVSFSLSVRNRSDYVLEHVHVVVDDPAGATFVAADPAPVRQAGTLAWDLPILDRGVAGPFRVTYQLTGAGPVASHARIEFRHRRPRGCNPDNCLPAFISETTSDSTPVTPAD
jgi:copper resistance protein C